MDRKFPLSGILLVLAACSANDPANGRALPETNATSAGLVAVAQGAATATPPAEGRSEQDSNEVYEFEYSYPADAAAYPGLKDLLDKRLADARGKLATEAQESKKEAEAEGYPYHAYAGVTNWQVVTQTPRFLSLSAQIYTYSGGAHGMTLFDTLLWDKQANTAREPSDLFVADEALRDAIRQPFCKALDRERAKRRAGYDRQMDGMFNECIDPTESTIILGSSNGKTFDRVGVLVGPYAAGPYAEGTYDITVPVNRAVLDAVKPAYRNAFAPGR